MRVALIHNFYDRRNPSGENSVVEDQRLALVNAGLDVEEFFTYSDEQPSGPVHQLRLAKNVATFGGQDPSDWLASLNPDVIHVHNLFPVISHKWLARWGHRTVATMHNFRPVCAAATLTRDGEPCTRCVDGSSLNAVRYRCYRDSVVATAPLAVATRNPRANNPILKHAQTLVTLNQQAADLYAAMNVGNSVATIPNFIKIPDELPRPTGAGGSWLVAGRLTTEKGIPWLLENWPADRHLTVVGSGPAEAAVAAAATGRPEIKLISATTRAEVFRIMTESQGLIVPSLWSEGLPTVILEALALGLPVAVSSMCAASQELVTGGGCAEFDPHDGREGLLRCLAQIEANSAMMRADARAAHSERYSEKRWISRITDLYTEISLRGPAR